MFLLLILSELLGLGEVLEPLLFSLVLFNKPLFSLLGVELLLLFLFLFLLVLLFEELLDLELRQAILLLLEPDLVDVEEFFPVLVHELAESLDSQLREDFSDFRKSLLDLDLLPDRLIETVSLGLGRDLVKLLEE